MLARFQGGFLDGLVSDLARHTRDGAAPDYVTIEITGEGRHGTELFEYSLMKLNTAPDSTDGAVAIYLCPVDPMVSQDRRDDP
jgi:hypothetical protein